MAQMLAAWQFWALGAAMFAALTAIFAKVGVRDIDPDFATFIRTTVVWFALGALVWASGKLQPLGAISARTGWFLLLSGLGTGASWLCYFRALQIGQASQVAPIDKLSIVLVAVFAALFLGEHLSLVGWGGIGLIALGAIMVAVG